MTLYNTIITLGTPVFLLPVLLLLAGTGLALNPPLETPPLLAAEALHDVAAEDRTRFEDLFSTCNWNSTGSVTGRAVTFGTPSSPAVWKMRRSSLRARKGCFAISSISAASISSRVRCFAFTACCWVLLFCVRRTGLEAIVSFCAAVAGA